MQPPKAFISYSWSSDQHQAWVISLANQLRENGVDVILDKWDLKEGNDAIAFMEKMVTDPEVRKVIVVLDRVYAEKADDRRGGVGTETQIITPHIYKSVDQNKFVGVISEVNPEGTPYLPTFYSSRIYIDLSRDELFTANFDQLLRWAFDKPGRYAMIRTRSIAVSGFLCGGGVIKNPPLRVICRQWRQTAMLLRLRRTVKRDRGAMVDKRYVLRVRSGEEPDSIMQPGEGSG